MRAVLSLSNSSAAPAARFLDLNRTRIVHQTLWLWFLAGISGSINWKSVSRFSELIVIWTFGGILFFSSRLTFDIALSFGPDWVRNFILITGISFSSFFLKCFSSVMSVLFVFRGPCFFFDWAYQLWFDHIVNILHLCLWDCTAADSDAQQLCQGSAQYQDA